jgi:hypothetical protein
MSDRREDDAEPIGIEADAPEADWIEQHQPVIDESDDEPYGSETAAGEAEPVGIEADAPEADWIEQHQPVVDESDEERFPTGIPEEAPEAEFVEEGEPPVATTTPIGDEARGDEPGEYPPSSGHAAARGCNLVGALMHALMRAARDIARRSTRPSR